MTILGAIFGSGSVLSGTSMRDTLDRASYAAQDKMGKFLSSGQRIVTLQDQARVFLKSDTAAARDRAAALVTQGDALRSSLGSLQTRAMSVLGQASDLRGKMDTDPFWKNVTQADWSSFGYETLSKAKAAAVQVGALAGSLYGLNKEMDSHMSQVDSYASDVGDLTGVAQGTGVNRLFNAAGAAGTMLKTNSLIIGLGAVAALAFLTWDALAPVKAARRASR